MKDVALITGGSSGIGRELAIVHAERGGDLVIVARGQQGLEASKRELESKHGVQVMAVTKDLSQAPAPRELYEEIRAAGVTVEFLINNAGFGGQGRFWERDWEKDAAMIDLNVRALTELCRLYLPEFVARNKGRILNVSSTASLMPGPLQAVYYATKAYVTSFSQAVAEELSDTDVTVTVLMPKATSTQFARTGGLEDTELFKGNLADPKVVARQGYDGMLAGKLVVYGGLPLMERIAMALIPLLPTKMVMRRIKKLQEAGQ